MLCCACPGPGWALEDGSIWERRHEPEHASGSVRHMTIGTKETLQTLTFSRQGNVTEKTTRNRTDLSATVEERMLYRYDPAGKMTGEFVADSDVEWVPLRLYLYDHEGRLAAEAAYHLCRTFSALHLYQYDEATGSSSICGLRVDGSPGASCSMVRIGGLTRSVPIAMVSSFRVPTITTIILDR